MDYAALAEELLERMKNLRRAGFQRHLDDYLQGENFVLGYIALQEGVVLPGDISQEMGVSSARVAATLNKLEKKGLITRKINKDDRRQVLVEITAAGSKLALSMHESFLEHTTAFFQGLGEKDAKEYLRITGRLADIVAEHLSQTEGRGN